MDWNENVTLTNDSATSVKRWLHALNFFQDKYLLKMFPNIRPVGPCPSPEILRGYYARLRAFEHISLKFLRSNPEGQIISLGAGFDTLFFRLNDQFETLRYLELDLPSVIRKKTGMFKRSKFEIPGNYQFLPVNLASKVQLESVLKSSIIQPGKPILILAECVFMYLETEEVSMVLNEIRSFSEINSESDSKIASKTASKADSKLESSPNTSKPQIYLISYDSLDKSDNFSKMMKENLLKTHEINLHLLTKPEYNSRLNNSGFNTVKQYTMLEVYNHEFLNAERRGIEKLVFLDDIEIWRQIMEHYSLVLGSDGGGMFVLDL